MHSIFFSIRTEDSPDRTMAFVQTDIAFEILSKIFLHCLPADDCGVASSKVDPREVPLLFTTICRLWRDVALGTPALWSHLQLPFPNNDLIIPALHTWLALSVPFTLTLDALRHDEDTHITSNVLEAAYIEALCAHASRWKRIQLRLTNTSSIRALASGLSATEIVSPSSLLPKLKMFHIAFPHPSDEADAEIDDDARFHLTFLSAISQCPKLSSLTLTNWKPILSFPPQCLPPTLSKFQLSYQGDAPFSVENFAACIAHCKNLVGLELNVPRIETFVDVPDFADILVLPSLRSLKLSLSTHQAFSNLVGLFSLPGIQILGVAVWDDSSDPMFFVLAFRELMQQCGSSLCTLELRGHDTPFHFLDFLVEMSVELRALRRLILRSTNCSEGVTTLLRVFKLRYVTNGLDWVAPDQNLTLESLYIDVNDHTVEQATVQGESRQLLIHTFCEFFIALSELVRSRSEFYYQGAMETVHPLRDLDVGGNLFQLYRRCYDEMCQCAADHVLEGWDRATELFKDMMDADTA